MIFSALRDCYLLSYTKTEPDIVQNTSETMLFFLLGCCLTVSLLLAISFALYRSAHFAYLLN